MRFRVGRLSAAVLLVLLVAGCSTAATQAPTPGPTVEPPTTGPTAAGSPAGEVCKIGTLQALTGADASLGKAFAQSYQIAIDEINAAGGVGGRPMELFVEDSKCQGPDAITAYTKLVSVDKVTAIVGSTCSGEMLAVADKIDKDKIPAIVNVSHPEVAPGHPFIFRNGPTSVADAKVMADDLVKQGLMKVAAITQETDYSVALTEALTKPFVASGGKVVADEKIRPEDTDFRAAITKLIASNPDAIFASFQNESGCGNFVRQARELGYKGPFYGSSLCISGTTLEIAGDAATGLLAGIAPVITPENQKGQDFVANYKAKYGGTSDEFYQAAAYDAIYLLKQCYEQVGSCENGDAVRDCLANIKDYQGTIGTYHFDQDGEIVGVQPVLVEVLPLADRKTAPVGYKVVER